MKAHSWQEAFWIWLSAVLLAIGGFCLIFFLVKDYSLRGWMNALFPIGAAMLLIPLQIYIHRTGTFDLLFFSFYRLFESWRPDNEKRYEDAYDYKETMRSKRQLHKPYMLPFFVVAALLLIASIVLVSIETAQIH